MTTRTTAITPEFHYIKTWILKYSPFLIFTRLVILSQYVYMYLNVTVLDLSGSQILTYEKAVVVEFNGVCMQM